MPDFIINAGLWVLSSIVFALLLSVVGNLITEPIKNYLGKISVTVRRNIIHNLKSELNMISNLRNSNQALNLYIIQRIFVIIRRLIFAALSLILCMLLFISTLPKYNMTDKIAAVDQPYIMAAMFFWFVFTIIIISATELCNTVIKNVNKVINFDKYKTKTHNRISEMEQKYIVNEEKMIQ